ncbi:OpcA, an allosteric effector of glucose-6-phosphate dehydrogenase, actinobacterial [Pseudonocardia sp. Ae406_Ps2]|uniref:glucose-6-phosphate dehydrogenase assembly protein OpcA n=1 Tax=unclassified Pseudonocardia TaxID=2619320 RepID=UPI00094B2E8B|nr:MULTISPECIES: glucose-6-phosphate dehydrogenase assembly protein OpcA [unclassified Pseudonocardia]OLM00691.1 OpcA, an allosteric effector of glucose-6-phosphate dehydrogenase, actinobacterial [Pseudonocardia sp. Ae406_Ps2]OLM07519.1 OpcA, an allosteric effector of glucose-6-phosphate dehydrogenase, actinobacterial [Pseudonocardia sp. Ae331_Ps2]OLM14709.1 OpcA, an allosteric effector of glucose-6-phosphate dehydrogenase, actinobacterial [Pseudonocardia sp. Ae505_Ps2]OLM22268.1 OpcA, an allos
MIIDLPSSTTSAVNRKLVELRESGGVFALGRVLTLVVLTEDGPELERAVDAANTASREHPCRVIVLARGQRRASPRLDAQIRVGGDAGASEVIVLRGYGPLADADAGAGMVMPLLLPDAPVVAWWPNEAPASPSEDAVGRLAQRRITDALSAKNPVKAFEARRKDYAPGDTDLTWTRLTQWRAQLAAALDVPPFEGITSAVVAGEAVSPSTELIAGWLAACLGVKVKRSPSEKDNGLALVRLTRPSGDVELARPDGKTARLSQPGQPERLIALARRQVSDCLAEELRRLDPDEVYAEALAGVSKVTRGRTPLKVRA